MPDALLLSLPLLLPLGGAVLALALRGRPRAQPVVGIGTMALLLAASGRLLARVAADGVATMQVGAWAAPFGITLVADLLSALMLTITALVGLMAMAYAWADADAARVRFGLYPLFLVLILGLDGAFLTGDLFNLYVWFEVLLIASFILMALGNAPRQLRGTVVYVVVSLVGSTLLLMAVALTYSITGTLNLADLAGALRAAPPDVATTLAVLFLVAFGLKAGVFPFFFWLPASYPTPPPAVAAVFAGLLTKVGVYALLRTYTLLFTQDVAYTHGTLLLWISGLTMLIGVLGALVQTDLRRILSFQVVSHIGYMTMGLALFSPLAVAGALFYLLHDVLVKTSLFLTGGAMARAGGSFALPRLGGLYRSRPLLAVLFVIPAFSLAGLPPLSGFWGKLMLVQAGLAADAFWIVTVALAVGLLTLWSMAQVWQQAFLKPRPDDAPSAPGPGARHMAPLVVLVAAVVLLGVFAQPVVALTLQAAEALLQPDAYVEAVLGPR